MFIKLQLNSTTGKYDLYKKNSVGDSWPAVPVVAPSSTVFNTAGSAYITFSFNGGTPASLTTFEIQDSIADPGLTHTLTSGELSEEVNYEATWSASATDFDAFEELSAVGMDMVQFSKLADKINSKVDQLQVNLTTNWTTYTFTYSGITYAQILAAVKAGKRVLIKASGPLASESNYTTGRWRTIDTMSPETLVVTLEFEGKYYDFTFNNAGTDGAIEERKVTSDNIDPSAVNRYSTTEAPIGVWIDGRTIYRKVFGPITINGTQTWISHGITNFETIINAYGFFGGNGGDIQPLPKITPDDHSYDLGIGNFYSDRFLIIKGSSLGNTWACVTLEYIKTS